MRKLKAVHALLFELIKTKISDRVYFNNKYKKWKSLLHNVFL